MENLGKWTGTTETSITNRIQEIKERISGAEDTIEEIDSSIKKTHQIQQILNSKHPGNLEHHEKIKTKNNRGRRKRRTPAQRPRKYIQQSHRRKLSQPREKYAYEGTRSLQNTNYIGPKKVSSSYNQTQNPHNKERLLGTSKEKGQVTYKVDLLELHPTSSWKPWKPESPGEMYYRH